MSAISRPKTLARVASEMDHLYAFQMMNRTNDLQRVALNDSFASQSSLGSPMFRKQSMTNKRPKVDVSSPEIMTNAQQGQENDIEPFAQVNDENDAPQDQIMEERKRSSLLTEEECFGEGGYQLTELEIQNLANFKKVENKYPVLINYLANVQVEINQAMRAILCDWLVEVAEEYNMASQTLFLAINYIDRFLSLMVVGKSQLQLVGVACMFIAAKFEELSPPNIDDFVYIADSTYSRQEICRMEGLVLKSLSYSLSVVTPFNFIEYFVSIAIDNLRADMLDFHQAFDFLAKYISELGLIDSLYFCYSPSTYAMSCVVLALFVLVSPWWNPRMEEACGRTFGELSPCIMQLHRIVSNPKNSKAIKEKYAQERFFHVADIKIPALV